MGREASQVLSPPQLSCESSVIADAHRIRDEFFNTIGRILPVGWLRAHEENLPTRCAHAARTRSR